MATAPSKSGIFQELADLLATRPSPKQLLQFQPSRTLQRRAQALLSRQGEMSLSYEEQKELDELLHAEYFIRLMKAKLRVQKGPQS